MIGQRLLHYEITEKLGEGGMGVVYKARDTHLDRFVAIKVLPPGRIAGQDRKARFAREAKAASALNHPNIITIHDIASDAGHDFIAMEYVAGKTLDQVIPRKGMRLNEALKIAVQIAHALARAHAAGIIHRDLKPANIMVDDHGQVKVLDFGLAKLTETTTSSDTETLTKALDTAEGTVVGTAAYMSPEQAEGKPVDARSDIFSFGSVLYEMLTGQRAFPGDTRMSTITAVLHKDPPPLPAESPYDLIKLILRCLRKDPERRYQHLADVRIGLEELKEESDSGRLMLPGTAGGKNRRRAWVWPAVAAVVIGAVFTAWKWHQDVPPQESYREIPFTADPGFEMKPSFSPDGLAVAYESLPPTEEWASKPPQPAVMVKMVGTESGTLLKESAIAPSWSPDGRWIAFGQRSNWFTPDTASLCIMPRVGGAERKLADLREVLEFQAVWTLDGKAIITVDSDGPDKPDYLVLVPVDSGEKIRLTTPPAGGSDVEPALSPDGRTLAFSRATSRGRALHLMPLDAANRPAGPPRVLSTGQPASRRPVWTQDGKEIIFCSRGLVFSTLWRVRADGSIPARPLPVGGHGADQPALSPAGDRLIYMKHSWDTDIWQIELLPSGAPAGEPKRFIYSNRADFDPAWSPDGRSIAFASQRAGGSQLWICDAGGGNPRPLASVQSAGSANMAPRWSPDSSAVAFHATATGDSDIYVVDVRGGTARNLTAGPARDYNPEWSADGKFIYFLSDRSGEAKTWKVPKDGGAAALEPEGRPKGMDPARTAAYVLRSSSGRLSLWRELSGGQPVKLLENLAEREVAVSSRGIYYVPRGPDTNPYLTGITFYSFASARSSRLADLKPHLGVWARTTPAVSPDGRYLLYTRYAQETNDLVLVENFR